MHPWLLGDIANVFKPRSLRERFLPRPRGFARRDVSRQRKRLAAVGGERLLRSPGDAGAVLLSPKPSAFAGGLDCRKLQRARADPVGRTRRFDALCAVARNAGHALFDVVVLWQSQANHAVYQAA